jgi:alpha-beta hydrolase superfamily lysophospholipase
MLVRYLSTSFCGRVCTAFFCAMLAFPAVGLARADERKDAEMTRCVADVREGLGPLDWNGKPTPTPAVRRYYAFYGLDIPDCIHRFGTLEAPGYTVAVHVFEPPDATRGVLVVHGYLDHAGVWSRIIRPMVEAGLLVVVYDQPGHGLSSGERADIPAFADYTDVFHSVFAECVAQRPMVWDVTAHSMGAAVVADYLLRVGPSGVSRSTEEGDEGDAPGAAVSAPVPERVVMLAPLVHSAAWKLSGFGQALARRFVDTVPRTYRDNTSDETFLEFVRRDPLQVEKLPLHWVTALRAWNRRLEKLPASDAPVTIVQGDDDGTVDWQYNLKVLRGKFPKATVVMLPGAKHQLMNERPEIRETVLGTIVPVGD